MNRPHPCALIWRSVGAAAQGLYEGHAVRVEHYVESDGFAGAIVTVSNYVPPVQRLLELGREHGGWRLLGSGHVNGGSWSLGRSSYSRAVPENVAFIRLRVLDGRLLELRAINGWVLSVHSAPVVYRGEGVDEIESYVTLDDEHHEGQPPWPNVDRVSVDPGRLTLLSDARHWVWATQMQIERFVAAYHSQTADSEGLPSTPEQRRSDSLTFAEAEFLLNAANHVLTALGRLPGAPKLNDDLAHKIRTLRNVHEHWDEQRAAFAHDDLPKERSGKCFANDFPESKPWSYGFGSDGHSISVLSLEDLWTELDAIDQSLSKPSNDTLKDMGIPHVPEGPPPPRPFPVFETMGVGVVVARGSLTQSVIVGSLPGSGDRS